MKFCSRKSRKVYDSILDIPCPESNSICTLCSIYPHTGGDCMTFCRKNPEDAARLMGCDVVYESGDEVRFVDAPTNHSPARTIGIVDYTTPDLTLAFVAWKKGKGYDCGMEPVSSIRLVLPEDGSLPESDTLRYDFSPYSLPTHELDILRMLGARWVSRGANSTFKDDDGSSVKVWTRRPDQQGQRFSRPPEVLGEDPFIASFNPREFPSIPEGTLLRISAAGVSLAVKKERYIEELGIL